jgi:hypothetical protein
VVGTPCSDTSRFRAVLEALVRKFSSFLDATSCDVDVVFIPHCCHSSDRKAAIALQWSLRNSIWEWTPKVSKAAGRQAGACNVKAAEGGFLAELCAPALCVQFRRRTEH